METIRIDFDVHKEIEKRRTSFDDTPNDVLRRVFDLPAITAVEETVEPSDTKEGLMTKGVFFANGTKLRNQSRGKFFSAIISDGKVLFEGNGYSSLSAAAVNAADGTSTNGWLFWEYYDEPSQEWELCKKKRTQGNRIS